MKSKQMKKWPEHQGATFQPGKGSHLKVFERQTGIPTHTWHRRAQAKDLKQPLNASWVWSERENDVWLPCDFNPQWQYSAGHIFADIPEAITFGADYDRPAD